MSGELEMLVASAGAEVRGERSRAWDPKWSSLESQCWQHKPCAQHLWELHIYPGGIVIVKVTSVLKVGPD